jgi:energy-coupling factor transporter ATP-binding protein EcfA2
LKASGVELTRAVDAMQSVMLRMLTAMPPSKVRFTIIDPVGLGDNFSEFMHLADYDEQLVANRIWTDPNHIEQQLADLTKHMENVIQVYLRKEFHSIDEYNASAGEMAEPYRVLVVANFPANFTESSVQRIKSIIASGAQCGVFVMLSVDTKLPMPRNMQLGDIEGDALQLHWEKDAFVFDHPDFGPLPITIDAPPPTEQCKTILNTVGSMAKDAGRVEVPFSCIIPKPDEWWTHDSRTGIDVPLGRSGAMKFQSLSLGSGTSQHVLISGKTGSGKSTLLHVLVTNMALRYSPNEVQLYLIDFKKGVEFKAYARENLPHARVIAIESEREFGLSVLQKLDAELRERGDLFRKHGVQDVKGYRNANPDAVLPRILLIIDEFQELFVEDDHIAQDSTLLLDRLVRQGRAFGIHILLGSQTLGGAYSLARSTVGQMAVRIALQCSEADSHLILSEDNTAARLLTRPGEAIYNDANGLFEGNHPFQIVWLSDHDRDSYLHEMQHLLEQHPCKTAPPIVFEGNIFADPNDNPALKELMTSPTWPESSPVVPAWLGSAVAIKEPTAAVFARQHASNLLMVGHREDAALGILASCFVSFAAQCAPKLPGTDEPASRFYILDGMRADAPLVGFWNRMASSVPHDVKVSGAREMPDTIAEIAAELAARQESSRENAPPIFLFVHNYGRFRDLKKEEDYGFSSESKGPNTSKQFAAILREGPPLGIHTLIWCDTYSNVSRMLDRQGMRDFEMRILFQMNASDSSSLMDSPDASRLGVHRAFLYDEGQGRMEKFSPYGLPSPQWLAQVKKQLTR